MNIYKVVVLVVAAILILLFSYTWLIPYYKTSNTKTYRQKSEEKLADKPYSHLKFSVSLLKQLEQDDPNGNIFFSPHSIYQALLLAYFGAAGETERQLKDVLGLYWAEHKTDVQHAYDKKKTELANRLQNQTVEFNSVNKLYFSTDIKIRVSMQQTLNDSIEQLDFCGEPDQCRIHINRFVEEVTKNNIKDFIPLGEISPNTQLVIVSAIYFKGRWEYPFVGGTKRGLFYEQHSPGPVVVDMMQNDGDYQYGFIDDMETEILKIPFKGVNESISMIVFLPRDIDELMKKLTPEIFHNAISSANRYKEVSLAIPMFTIEKTTALIKPLKRMGIIDLFDGNANLTDFSEVMGTKDCDIMHKSKIEVDKYGTKAVAATSIIVAKSAAPIRKEFKCDHPFIFVLHDKIFNEILFAGIYRGPNKN